MRYGDSVYSPCYRNSIGEIFCSVLAVDIFCVALLRLTKSGVFIILACVGVFWLI